MLHDEVLEITVQKEKCKNYIPLFVMMWEVFSNETDGESFLMCNNVMGSWKYLKSEKTKWCFWTIKATSLQLTTKNALSWSSFLCNINCIQNRQKLHYRIAIFEFLEYNNYCTINYFFYISNEDCKLSFASVQWLPLTFDVSLSI